MTTFTDKQADLEALAHAIRLLGNAASAIEEANALLVQAKYLASDINDPELRRKVMAAAGKLKASNEGF
jgi:hypothetical protein